MGAVDNTGRSLPPLCCGAGPLAAGGIMQGVCALPCRAATAALAMGRLDPLHKAGSTALPRGLPARLFLPLLPPAFQTGGAGDRAEEMGRPPPSQPGR